jgi:CHAT domain-containing protein
MIIVICIYLSIPYNSTEPFNRRRIQMKKTIIILAILISTLSFFRVSAQTIITKDTTLANQYFEKATTFENNKQPDSAIAYYDRSALIVKRLIKPLKFWSAGKYLTCLNKMTSIFITRRQFDQALVFADSSIRSSMTLQGDSSIYSAQANNNKGSIYLYTTRFDDALLFYHRSADIYKKRFGKKNADLAMAYSNIGLAHKEKSEYQLALTYYQKGADMIIELSGMTSPVLGDIYDKMGIVYFAMDEHSKALECFSNGLTIREQLFGQNNADVASSYNNIGTVYWVKNDRLNALKYFLKSLSIKINLKGEKDNQVASSYNNIGAVYRDNSEYDKALEYYIKSLTIKEEIYGKKHKEVAKSYNNIGTVYQDIGMYDKALEYYHKSLAIRKELYGDKHELLSVSYGNIGLAYNDKKDFEKALDYFFRSMAIQKEVLGEKHSDLAETYVNVGDVYINLHEYDRAQEYLLRALNILKTVFGEKHKSVARVYRNLGQIHYLKNEYPASLAYFQQAVSSCLWDSLATVDTFSAPVISNHLSWTEFINALSGKANVLSAQSRSTGKQEFLKFALNHYMACDTLLDKTRKEISGQSDKISLGESASAIYEKAVDVCNQLKVNSIKAEDQNKYKELSFYFSEKNKASVLLESLSGQQALQFAGIPDSLLAKEHDLRIDINFYNKQLADMPDSAKQVLFRDRLFSCNRSYDSLIIKFEELYPDYYNLKYSESTASVSDIQKQLDPSTAMISYFAGDSTITIFTITNHSFETEHKSTPFNFLNQIESYRRSLTNTASFAQQKYKKAAYQFYDLLIPKKLNKKIKNLIIIPDHALATIPFETFLTKPVTDQAEMHKLPYLINQYAISYSYSATLFMKTFPKEKTKEIELRDLNDWLAFAPVADTSQTGMSLASRELLQRYQNLSSDSMKTRGMRDYFAPLPGTLSEVSTILNIFDQNKAKAKIEVNKNADEKTIKSGLLKDYRILHFATHGMVNNEKPELSCILLASADSTDTQNDGILYSGEIYNLKLNADLVVLSACETGLGKIKKGEGILGLTRALLYAGSKNIIVSLWQVSDQSTSDMMIVFYDDLLNKGLSKSDYSKSLQHSKRYMIKNKQYAHPFYWSPFVLIGK